TLAQTRIADLVAVLNAMLAQVPASEFNSTDNIYTTAEGAKFNSGLGAIVSSAVHNPFMTEALLTGSITQVELDYGIAPSPSLILENILGEVSALQR
ncbi:MAG: hypothetical protein OEZ37_02850, partial [Gemmatimonadota bacterium]|nr:hypothetical protein [Gemmatimonadota bacterium]